MRDVDVLVIGAGAAGTAAVSELRNIGYDGRVLLLNGESSPPYNRTMVNKTLLRGADLASVATRLPEDAETVVLDGVRAVSLDAAGSSVRLTTGDVIGYRAALLATGGRPNPPPVPVDEQAQPAVTTLRTAADADRLRGALQDVTGGVGPARVAIIGGGLLGAETADGLTEAGHRVHLVDLAADPLARLIGAGPASWVAEQQRRDLAGLHAAKVSSLGGRLGDLGVALSDGTVLDVDVLVAAVGIRPDVEWLVGSGLALDDGVETDDRLRVLGAANLFAAGDLARMEGKPRVEHWSSALAQGAHAARAIAHLLTGSEDPGPYAKAASYATRLHGKPVSVIGQVAGGREVEVTSVDQPVLRVSAFVDADERLCGAVVLGPPKVANKVRPLVAERASLSELDAVAGAWP